MGTLMSLELKVKLAVVQLASDWQNGKTFTSDWTGSTSRIFLLEFSCW